MSVGANKARYYTLAAYALLAAVTVVASYSIYRAQTAQRAEAIVASVDGSPRQAPATNALLGSRRPSFSLTDLSGASVSVARWDGKVLLLNFWATWCAPCRREMPVLVALQRQYQPRGFQVVGVAVDDPAAVGEFTDAIGATYPQLVGQESAMEVARRYGDHYGAIPYSVLVDRQGTIRLVHPGELSRQELEAKLQALL